MSRFTLIDSCTQFAYLLRKSELLGSRVISIGLESYGKDRYYAEKGQKMCECCGAGMALNSFHCKTCGDVSEWKKVK